MNKLLVSLLLLAMPATRTTAATIDETLGAWWKSVTASENFHLLDNASIELCKDLGRHRYYTGSSTYLYRYGYASVDFIGIKPLDSSSTVIPGAGVKFFLGDYLYEKVKPVRNVVNYLMPEKPILIDNITLGIGATRNFETGETIQIIYGGLVKKF